MFPGLDLSCRYTSSTGLSGLCGYSMKLSSSQHWRRRLVICSKQMWKRSFRELLSFYFLSAALTLAHAQHMVTGQAPKSRCCFFSSTKSQYHHNENGKVPILAKTNGKPEALHNTSQLWAEREDTCFALLTNAKRHANIQCKRFHQAGALQIG